MFHLTPQERSAIAVLLTVVLVGTMVHFFLSKDVPLTRWVTKAKEHRKPALPDINFSGAAQLEKLPGIGIKTAQNIVNYRIANGPFLRLGELRKVKGITKANFKKIEEAYGNP
jgi:competence ComEA-like helix-hairpin-helix protein